MKILYVSTISNTVNAFLIPHIEMLIQEGHVVDVAFRIEQEVQSRIIEMGCIVHEVSFRRSPISLDNLKAYSEIKRIIQENNYNIVHTHTPIASAIVRIACKNLVDVKVFYTAHGFHFYKGAPLANWLMYYPIEKWLARYTDVIITINNEDYEFANRKLKSKKVEYVPGVGLNIGKFSKVLVDARLKRSEIGIPENSYVVLSIGELNKNKNHESIIKAIANLNIPDIHYVVCGQGSRESYLRELSMKLNVVDRVHLLGYRNDIPQLCKVSDLFAFPSFREGLSVSLMESMAHGLPVICSKIRGNIDLIEEGKGGYLVEPTEIEKFANCIRNLYLNKEVIEFGAFNINKISNYSIDFVLLKLKRIYDLHGKGK